jgi:HSP20 family molecular chaperone IbpA
VSTGGSDEGTDPDKISADLKQGVLVPTVPKRPETKPKGS